MKGTHGDHSWCLCDIHLTTHNGLQRGDDVGANDHRIYARPRTGGMCLATIDSDLETLSAGRGCPFRLSVHLLRPAGKRTLWYP